MREVIKALEENGTRKFVCDRQPDNPIGLINDTLCWLESKEPIKLNFESWTNVGTIDKYDWELVRERFDFMTAVNSGKKVRPLGSYFDRFGFQSWTYWSLSLDMINGKWLVE